MATPSRTTGLTYQDLETMFPEDDRVIRELIDGELFVTPSPTFRHQRVAWRLGHALAAYEEEYGGMGAAAPVGLYVDESNFVEPDVLFVRADHHDRIEGAYVRGAPDLVVEISSPSTRKRDVTRKRSLYERSGVPEYWFLDLDAERIEVYRLEGDRFGPPILFGHSDTVESSALPGFSISVAGLFRPDDE